MHFFFSQQCLFHTSYASKKKMQMFFVMKIIMDRKLFFYKVLFLTVILKSTSFLSHASFDLVKVLIGFNFYSAVIFLVSFSLLKTYHLSEPAIFSLLRHLLLQHMSSISNVNQNTWRMLSPIMPPIWLNQPWHFAN